MLIDIEIDRFIKENHIFSIKKLNNQNEIDLTVNNGSYLALNIGLNTSQETADCFNRRPKSPTNIDDLQDLTDYFKLTTTKERFLASQIK